MHRARIPAIAALALISCDDLRTESRDFGVSFGDFPMVGGSSPYLALEGTRLCAPSPRCGPCDEEPPICERVDLTVEGADADADGCYAVELDTPLTFTFAPQGCTTEVATESLTVEAIGPAEAGARLDPAITLAEDLAEVEDGVASQGDPPPAATALVPLQLLADRDVPLGIRLHESATDREVGWNPSTGALGFQAISGAAPTVQGDVGEITVSLAAGAQASASLDVAGADFPLADVVGVDAAAIDRIELTALFLDGGAEGQQPAQIEAHVKDAAGDLILGVPIEWRVVDGDLVIGLGEEGDPTDAVALKECVPRRPESTRRGVVEASFGEHRATLEITWKGYTGDEPVNAGPCADQGCGCSSDPGGSTGLAGLALALLALGRRRRR